MCISHVHFPLLSCVLLNAVGPWYHAVRLLHHVHGCGDFSVIPWSVWIRRWSIDGVIMIHSSMHHVLSASSLHPPAVRRFDNDCRMLSASHFRWRRLYPVSSWDASISTMSSMRSFLVFNASLMTSTAFVISSLLRRGVVVCFGALLCSWVMSSELSCDT